MRTDAELLGAYAPFDAMRPAISDMGWQGVSTGSIELEIQGKDASPKSEPPQALEVF